MIGRERAGAGYRVGEPRGTNVGILATAIWFAAVAGTLLPGATRGLVEIPLLIGGPAWAVAALVTALDREFELSWAAGIAVTLAEWALGMLGALWAGFPLDDTTVLVILLAILLWPTLLVGVSRRHAAVTRMRNDKRG